MHHVRTSSVASTIWYVFCCVTWCRWLIYWILPMIALLNNPPNLVFSVLHRKPYAPKWQSVRNQHEIRGRRFGPRRGRASTCPRKRRHVSVLACCQHYEDQRSLGWDWKLIFEIVGEFLTNRCTIRYQTLLILVSPTCIKVCSDIKAAMNEGSGAFGQSGLGTENLKFFGLWHFRT